MFTGIVESLGSVQVVSASPGVRRLVLEIGGLAGDLSVGDSLAVSGVCLTVTEVSPPTVATDIVSETLGRTNLGGLSVGDRVNLERPMRADGRFDGHIVQGHIDSTGQVVDITRDGGGCRLTVRVLPTYQRYLVEKGSVTVDGVSLTLAGVTEDGFEVALIPHTMTVTTLGLRQPGDLVNLEFDVLAKYVERLLESRQ